MPSCLSTLPEQIGDGELLYLQPQPVTRHGPADGTALEGGKLACVDFHILNPQEVGSSGYMKKREWKIKLELCHIHLSCLNLSAIWDPSILFTFEGNVAFDYKNAFKISSWL